MANNNTIADKSNFQSLPNIAVTQKIASAEFNEIKNFQNSPSQQISGSLTDTNIIIDGTKQYLTTIAETNATRTITANAAGHLNGNRILQRYSFAIDCILTLTNFDSGGSDTGIINPINAGTYDFIFSAGPNGVSLKVLNNAAQGGGGSPNFGNQSTKTIATGVIATGTNRNIIAAAQTGTADDLIEITGLTIGDKVLLRADAGDTITVKHNDAGATIKILIQDNADFVLDEKHPLELVLISTNELVQVYDEVSAGLTNKLDKVATADQSIASKVEFKSQAHANTGTNAVKTFSATPTFDFDADGNDQQMTLTGNVTTFSTSNSVGSANYSVWIINDGTAGRTVSTPVGWTIMASSDTHDTAANAENLYQFKTRPDGTKKYSILNV